MTFDEASLCHEVARVLQEAGLLDDTRPLLVAVSGGPDSLALLHLLHTLSGRHPLSLHVAHLNHGLRGPGGGRDPGDVHLRLSRSPHLPRRQLSRLALKIAAGALLALTMTATFWLYRRSRAPSGGGQSE